MLTHVTITRVYVYFKEKKIKVAHDENLEFNDRERENDTKRWLNSYKKESLDMACSFFLASKDILSFPHVFSPSKTKGRLRNMYENGRLEREKKENSFLDFIPTVWTWHVPNEVHVQYSRWFLKSFVSIFPFYYSWRQRENKIAKCTFQNVFKIAICFHFLIIKKLYNDFHQSCFLGPGEQVKPDWYLKVNSLCRCQTFPCLLILSDLIFFGYHAWQISIPSQLI